MSVQITNNSRLRFGNLVSAEGVEFWDVLDLPEIVPQADDLTYTVTSTDRIDLLANQFYGDPVLWWVIAVANDLEILPTAMIPGQRLRIPSARYVLQDLFKKSKVQGVTEA
jgi:nucleoid-associated protein YgaU